MQKPILEPIPIETKGKSFFKKISIWLMSTRKWRLVEDWKYDLMLDGGRETIIIKSGFVFDGASIPKILRPLFSPVGIFLIPGLVHDYAYRYQKIDLIDNTDKIPWSIGNNDHKYWDRLFRDISIEVNECVVSSYSAWIALHLFGGFAWRKNEKMMIEREWKHLEEMFGDDV